ncbi:putative DNA replication complex GINS protein PSF3 [Iris pallida]|uniref:DNA replication complex GINS protein PSF3 n=1 Tax=Iris pallida TaxID=29817 RepID=A0AAX6EWC0_IRIPA|nr:putative DNA replication complex GINS protein PSF3 [Iris pallida]KAJ6815691.1 putative DNA replication complex GINS protein PSF3 [Iris pallida]KAJ6854361.1 putative DNA replication complex GINS protein PSF3 [Iris pallida]
MSRFYDIDDILVEEESLTNIFQVGVNGVGLLDPSAETNSVEKGAKVDLPVWLAHELYLRRAALFNVPACFSQKTRKEIQADAACVDLRFRSPYFYELGCKIAPQVADKTIGSFLLYTFDNRYKEILCKAHSTPVATVPKLLNRLTKEETNLFEAARSSMVAFRKWREGGSRLERASVLGRKRKSNIPIPQPSTP